MDPQLAAIVTALSLFLSLAATACAIVAWRAADPVRVRTLGATVDAVAAEMTDQLSHFRDVELGRVVGQCEAILERAEDRFDAAERKRKSLVKKGPAAGNADGEADLATQLSDEGIPRAERIRLLRASGR